MLLMFVSNLHIARHVDIDGFHSEPAAEENGLLYTQTVGKVRLLSRTLEAVVQALYDDASIMFLTTQHIRQHASGVDSQDGDDLFDYLDALGASIKSNLQFLLQTLDALLSVGHDQADIAEGDYKGAIEWRVSRLSIMDSNYDARPMSVLNPADPESEDIVDIEVAFGVPGSKKGTAAADPVPSFRSQSQMSDNTITLEDLAKPGSMRSAVSSDYTLSVHTLVPSERHSESTSDAMSINDGECRSNHIIICSALDDEVSQRLRLGLLLMPRRSRRSLATTLPSISSVQSHGTYGQIIPIMIWSLMLMVPSVLGQSPLW